MSQKLLKDCIRALINEAAVPTSAAARDGLALYIHKYQKSVRFVLYDPYPFEEWLRDNPPVNMSYDEIPNGIFAFFQLTGGPDDSCEGASEVAVSSAQKGYGPMMYDICMSYSYPTPIMPDRTLVSPAAANVWTYYQKRNDVEKIPLSDNDCKLQQNDNLNFAYRGKNADFSGLVTNHENFIGRLGHSADGFMQNIVHVGTSFFDRVV